MERDTQNVRSMPKNTEEDPKHPCYSLRGKCGLHCVGPKKSESPCGKPIELTYSIPPNPLQEFDSAKHESESKAPKDDVEGRLLTLREGDRVTGIVKRLEESWPKLSRETNNWISKTSGESGQGGIYQCFQLLEKLRHKDCLSSGV